MQRKIKENKKFIIMLFIFSVFLFRLNYDYVVNIINSTMYAFSYRYGFISRGLAGTVYQFLNQILPFDLMHNQCLTWYSLLLTWCVILLFLALVYVILEKCQERERQYIKMFSALLLIFLVPTFATNYNLGRLDIYLVGIDILCCLLLIAEKLEWCIIPLSMIAVMLHQGYVFMYFSVILVILIYKFFTVEDKKKKRKYALIFIFSFLGASAFFLWFELFSHISRNGVYEEIISTAKILTSDGQVHQDVIDHEILGVDLSDREWGYHIMNFVQTPFVIVLFWPYIRITFSFFKKFR